MAQFFLSAGAILAGISVAGGAFATHALRAKLDVSFAARNVFEL